MVITFSVNGQKITHDLKGSLVAGSVGVVKAAFEFDKTWCCLDTIAVFKNSQSCKPVPVKYYPGTQINVPESVLVPGKLYVSVVGFGQNGTRKTTQAWDIQQALTVTKCGALGGCDLLRNMVQVPDAVVATDEEYDEMMGEIFPDWNKSEPEPLPDGAVVATDEEAEEMFNEVFGTNGPSS